MKVSEDGRIDPATLSWSDPVECWVVNIYWITDGSRCASPVEKRWANRGEIYRKKPKGVFQIASRLDEPIYATEEAAWKEAERRFRAWCDERMKFIERRGVPLPVEKKTKKRKVK